MKKPRMGRLRIGRLRQRRLNGDERHAQRRCLEIALALYQLSQLPHLPPEITEALEGLAEYYVGKVDVEIMEGEYALYRNLN